MGNVKKTITINITEKMGIDVQQRVEMDRLHCSSKCCIINSSMWCFCLKRMVHLENSGTASVVVIMSNTGHRSRAPATLFAVPLPIRPVRAGPLLPGGVLQLPP